MGWTARDIPDLTGSVAVVTGASSGLGLETSHALARAGAHVVMLGRDPRRVHAAATRIAEAHPHASLAVLMVDLSSLESIATAARTVLMSDQRVDILVNNAGVRAVPWQRTVDGFEMQVGVNHLGHFALTARLLPALLRAPAARVVSATSTAHHLGRTPGDGTSPGRYHPWLAYGRSKLANLHFAIGLHRLFAATGAPAASLAADPGLTTTGRPDERTRDSGGRRSPWWWAFLAACAGMAPDRAALPLLRAATDPAARSGELYAPMLVTGGPPVRRPLLLRTGLDRAIRRLWTESERATGVPLDVGALRRCGMFAATAQR